jgi:hypothetical protein
MEISKWNHLIDILLLVSFVIVAVTGVLLLLDIKGVFIFRSHGLSGIVSIGLVLVHVVLHKRELLAK